jgi:hypothetical protein
MERDLQNTNEDVKNFVAPFSIDKKSKLIYRNEEPNMNNLSKFSVEILDETIEKYGKINSHELSTISHDKAWEKAIMLSSLIICKIVLSLSPN